MTQPVQKRTVDAHSGWHYLTHWMGSNTPYKLTHGGNIIRSMWGVSRRGKR